MHTHNKPPLVRSLLMVIDNKIQLKSRSVARALLSATVRAAGQVAAPRALSLANFALPPALTEYKIIVCVRASNGTIPIETLIIVITPGINRWFRTQLVTLPEDLHLKFYGFSCTCASQARRRNRPRPPLV